MRKKWRCFHCDAVFTNQYEAGIHFGADVAGTCACVLPHERHLVEHIRDLEGLLNEYRGDRDQITRSIMTLEADHRSALQREEEKGYARGLSDGRDGRTALDALEQTVSDFHETVEEFKRENAAAALRHPNT